MGVSQTHVVVGVLVVAVIIMAAVIRRNRPDKFLGAIAYTPAFIDPLGSSRYTSKGYTTGYMPSIDADAAGGWMCPGLLGVPP